MLSGFCLRCGWFLRDNLLKYWFVKQYLTSLLSTAILGERPLKILEISYNFLIIVTSPLHCGNIAKVSWALNPTNDSSKNMENFCWIFVVWKLITLETSAHSLNHQLLSTLQCNDVEYWLVYYGKRSSPKINLTSRPTLSSKNLPRVCLDAIDTLNLHVNTDNIYKDNWSSINLWNNVLQCKCFLNFCQMNKEVLILLLKMWQFSLMSSRFLNILFGLNLFWRPVLTEKKGLTVQNRRRLNMNM